MPEKTPNIPSEPSEAELEKEQKFREAKIKEQTRIERAVREGRMIREAAPKSIEELEKPVHESLAAEEKAERERSEKQPVVRHDEPISYAEMFPPKANPEEKERGKRREAAIFLGLPENVSWDEIENEKRRQVALASGLPETASWEEIESKRGEAPIKSQEPVLEEIEELIIEPEKKPTEAKFKETGTKELDIEKAMKEPGNFEFVTKYARDPEKLDKKEIRDLLEARETSNLVKEFYREKIERDIGLKLENEEINGPLDAYFVSMKDVDPKFAEQIRTSIQESYELPKRIAEKENELEVLNRVFGPRLPIEKMSEYTKKTRRKLGGLEIELGQMERKREISKTMHGIRGFFNWRNSGIIQFLVGGAEMSRRASGEAAGFAGKIIKGKDIQRVYEEIQQAKGAKSKTVGQWQLRLEILSRRIDKLTKETLAAEKVKTGLPKAQEELEALKEKTIMLKNFFFGDYFTPAASIIKIAKDKLREKFNSIADPKKTNIKILEKGLEELPKFGKAEIVNLGKSELGEFEKKFDDLIEQRANRDILARLKKLTLNKVNPLKSIEKEASVYLKREKLGKRGKKEIEETVVKILTNYIKRTEPPTGEKPEIFKAKKIAAKCFLIKLGYA